MIGTPIAVRLIWQRKMLNPISRQIFERETGSKNISHRFWSSSVLS